MKRIFCSCINCKNLVAAYQLNVHQNGSRCKRGKCGFKKVDFARVNFNCLFCQKECKNKNSLLNHERLCKNNPNKQEHPKGMLGKKGWNNGLTEQSDDRVKRISESIRKYKKENGSNWTSKCHSDETKNKLSIISCERLSKHSKYSKNIEYNGSILESTYELEVAKILDELEITWEKVRKGFVWNDGGKQRRYVPDFYLPKYYLYLDPKNDYLIKKDKINIDSAIEINKIKIVVLSKENINIDFIKNMLR